MCGIVGYVGNRRVQEILLEGLRRLEYRGYDSAGIASFCEDKISVVRTEGKIRVLEEKLTSASSIDGSIGIGHTRWATHGRPSERNAHPHVYGSIAVVHNGIIENYVTLKEKLERKGHVFSSETDTEVIAHLIEQELNDNNDFTTATRNALRTLKGSFAVAVICEGCPDQLITGRKESPMIVGLGEGEYFAASDIPAILSYTRTMIFLEDGELAVLSNKQLPVLMKLDGEVVSREPKIISWDPIMAEKEGYKHFMLKEIFEQPRAITDTIRGRVDGNSVAAVAEQIRLPSEVVERVERLGIVACGTSWHAGLAGKYMIEDLCGTPVDVDLGSEFRYRNPLVNDRTLMICISQSGETADTLAALREAKKKGARIVSICNVIDSSVARESDDVLYTRAGPEIGVASTKAFTTQLVVLYLFALYWGLARKTLSAEAAGKLIDDLIKLPVQAEHVLQQERKIREIAKHYVPYHDFLFLGRGINYPIALEGALKLKEISYIHAEGYPAGEMKHGPIALIDERTPSVVLLSHNSTYEKMLGNIEEIRAREGKVIAITSFQDAHLKMKVDDLVTVPANNLYLTPVLLTIPLQLFAYHVAVLRGTDVDQPRNLAKSVTVE
ncbi:MAG TPA: glutamine--fructose-6-phosphate transaminase (isomerizing) [Thermodesulfobacteriota bacterium]|nr:glutamine--fructose-6-phosphate transaminase (isomerizing) [Deltaproteobacteria bacterium]HNU70499.1 glutamine--fructose-6-phosphate transaminase (isomerizing) [Thermodesulfobacteriota bacterium]